MENNKKNEGKKRPICACGEEMKYIEYIGYYDSFEYWRCDANGCTVEDDFEPDERDRGSFA